MCLEKPKGDCFVCFPRRSALLVADSSWSFQSSHGFAVPVVLSPAELGNPRVLDQLIAEGTPRSHVMNASLRLGLENSDQGWAGLGLSQGAGGLNAPI